MEESLYLNDRAEFALSAMVTMIMILLFSAIIAGLSLMMVEKAFMESQGQSVQQSETINSVPVVLAFEIEEFDSTGNTNDRLYLMFKFPYASNSIPDTNVKWAMLCDINDTATPPRTGTAHTLVYSSGDFDSATELISNGDTLTSDYLSGKKEIVAPLKRRSFTKKINVLGKDTNQKGFNIEIYDDGSVQKKYLIE